MPRTHWLVSGGSENPRHKTYPLGLQVRRAHTMSGFLERELLEIVGLLGNMLLKVFLARLNNFNAWVVPGRELASECRRQATTYHLT